MKALLLSIRTILRFRTYTAINVLGLALSLGCVFVLVRYIHQECTVNHFVPEADRTFLTAVFKEGEPRGSLGESGDRNNDPNYRNPLDHPAGPEQRPQLPQSAGSSGSGGVQPVYDV